MSPKPYTPDDEMPNSSDANAPVKKTKGGNAQKRIDYFMQQRFPSLVTPTEDIGAGTKKRGLKQKATMEEQQAAIAPLARIRVNMIQEYKRRLLRQRQELEKAATKQPPAADDHE